MIEISPVTLTHSVTGFAIGNLPLSCSPAIVLDDATADATQSAASERHTVSSQIGRNSARFRSASPPSANAQYREDSGRADRCRCGSAARSRVHLGGSIPSHYCIHFPRSRLAFSTCRSKRSLATQTTLWRRSAALRLSSHLHPSTADF